MCIMLYIYLLYMKSEEYMYDKYVECTLCYITTTSFDVRVKCLQEQLLIGCKEFSFN